ncbi:MAG: hypothetical protein JST54_22825 [Deltaproteobacteria bacterium]|nr:hypothetical protein [Deltaproteobacteria bacterium]
MNIKKTLLVAAIAAAGTVGAATAARAADDANVDPNMQNQNQPGMNPSGADQMNQGMKDQGMKEQGMEQGNLREATITVLKVDKATHTVTFKAKVQPEANLTKDGQPIKLDQLKEGDQVRASFDPATGDVKSLEVSRKVKGGGM